MNIRLKVSILLCGAFIAFSTSAYEPVYPLMFQSAPGAPLYFAEQLNFTNTPPLDSPLSEADTSSELPPVLDDILSEAKTHLGTRYRRGGKSPAGFDCSGFTGYVFRQFGYRLGASSRDQYARDGVSVPTDEIRPGDLVFFKGRSKGSVGHVGIAVDRDPATGDVTFIHSATSSGIRYDRISAPYYRQRFLGARRVIHQ